jgi:transcriptional regulator with XRE-family HTH domain
MSNSKGELTPEQAFGMVIRERRKKLGLKQTDLEADDMMDRSYISKLESGTRQISLRGIIHLAKVLHTTPADLLAEMTERMK